MSDGFNPAPYGGSRVRSAATKRDRTRQRLLLAARELVRRYGLETRAEAVAAEAGVSTATFYNVFPSKGAMYQSVFRELVLPSRRPYDEYIGEADSLHTYLSDLIATCGDDAQLIRGLLVARLESQPAAVTATEWLDWKTDGDVVLLIARELLRCFTHGFAKDLKSPTFFEIQTICTVVHLVALGVLDLLSEPNTRDVRAHDDQDAAAVYAALIHQTLPKARNVDSTADTGDFVTVGSSAKDGPPGA